MGNAFGSGNNEKNKRKLSETRDDDEDEHDPLYSLPDEVQRIVLGDVELSAEQLKAAGHLKYELIARKRDYTSNPVLALDDVEAIAPPSTLDYDDSELNVIHACCYFEWTSPPDDATIRAMGDVERRGLWRFWSRPWRMRGGGGYDNAGRSLQTGESFKAMAFKLNGGERPDEAFFLKHFKVRRTTYENMSRPKRVWYVQLNVIRLPSRDYAWVETNKQWLEEHGVFSACDKYCASADFVGQRGNRKERKTRSTEIRRDLNERLQCREFVDDDGTRLRVLAVRWSEDVQWSEGLEPEPQFVVLCYEARLADPHANQTHSSYLNRMLPDSSPMSVEEVEDLIARAPKRART